MRRYIIRKYECCNKWYIRSYIEIGSFIYFTDVGYFENWWDNGLMIINFPELVRYKSYV